MMVAINPSINLYAQLALLVKLRAKDCRPSFSAGAVLHLLILRGAPKIVSFFDGSSDFFMDRNQVQKSIGVAKIDIVCYTPPVMLV